MQPGTVSLMPQGFDQRRSRHELGALRAFLKATRSAADQAGVSSAGIPPLPFPSLASSSCNTFSTLSGLVR